MVRWLREEVCRNRQAPAHLCGRFHSGARVADVVAEHLLNDYWLISTYPVRLNSQGRAETDATETTGIAVARVVDSRDSLPYAPGDSPRLF